MNFDNILNFFKGLVKPNIISPIPEINRLDDPAKRYYVSQDTNNIGTDAAKPRPQGAAQDAMDSINQYQQNMPRVLGASTSNQYQQPTPTPTSTIRVTQPWHEVPNATPTPGAQGWGYVKSHIPNGQTMQQAFPALANPQFVEGVNNADKIRKGLTDLLLLQGYFESNLGRTTPNVFGVKPQGQSRTDFSSPTAALQYQLGSHVLGGGANPNMNVLGGQGPIGKNDIVNLYKSYNPESDYLKQLLAALGY